MAADPDRDRSPSLVDEQGHVGGTIVEPGDVRTLLAVEALVVVCGA
jgi:hypothetical protein